MIPLAKKPYVCKRTTTRSAKQKKATSEKEKDGTSQENGSDNHDDEKKDNASQEHEEAPTSVCKGWAEGHTDKEIGELQEQDLEVGPVYKWKQTNGKPDRDLVARYSPATRHYWLNWENLTLKN